ncbi:uncharacterized protein C8Q71DRAFT_785316 [Rhodofomes roseus]|uniref:Uncharacterized protein n=1 Tax=Rhodofomes roseus TaxID=34475 RepID=A0ABQ8K1V2_9APHY|nr:uncharacterized protein C8Q71DRAFT_785316 [Rhodofomes roseus]KAH9830647.1 hypothetical protein C8Q71DRAFT_785316 [Rhodofomes roseus]
MNKFLDCDGLIFRLILCLLQLLVTTFLSVIVSETLIHTDLSVFFVTLVFANWIAWSFHGVLLSIVESVSCCVLVRSVRNRLPSVCFELSLR